MGEIFYEEPYSQIWVGDAREVLSHLPENSVDAVVTSPPY